MKKIFWFVGLALFVVLGFTGCGEKSIYGTWRCEDKGVIYEIRFYNEFGEDKYEQFRDGSRTSSGTFTIIDDLLYTKTYGNYDAYKYRLTFNTLSLNDPEFPTSYAKIYKKKKVNN